MGHPILRLWEDILSGGASLALPPLPRMIFLVHGAVTIAERNLHDGDAWHGEGGATIRASEPGASLWRWELVSERDASAREGQGGGSAPPRVRSREKLAAELRTLADGDLLLRGDSVAFPPGGCAYLHRHQGPGIRCLLEGAIRIDTHGASTSYGPGDAWYESGPEPVFAQAASDRPTRFIRVMILPRSFLGRSSVQYVNEQDKDKPRVQQYKVFADFPVARPAV